MSRRSLFVTVLLFLFAFVLRADQDHQHDHGPIDLGKLGKVRFETSCKPAVREDFSRAVAMMHSFWYAESEKAFHSVAQKDPACAMAWWGVAMSNYHPLWAPPTPDELKRGKEAAEKAMAMTGGTARERDYIAAIHAFYADADKRDHRTRALAYEKAMESVAAKHPKDREAGIFYALALNGTAQATDKTYANQKRAAQFLNRVLPVEPEHPGVAHYLIHSYDYPELASLAVEAARVYAKIAPGSPHALHMPSHIFTRLGLWDESISSNLASAEKARHYVKQVKPGASSFDELHAVDYLVYAYLQQGRDEKAKELLDKLRDVNASKLDLANFAAAYAASAAPARYALERRQWREAAELKLPDFPWKNYEYAEANHHFGRAIGGARSGDLNAAKESLDRLTAIRKSLLDQKSTYWADQVEIQRLAAQAWLVRAVGLNEEAVRLMRAAADLESKTEKHPVTPGAILPARELLADMLLEDGNAAEALKEAELTLTVAPNRFNTLWVAARASEKANDPTRAADHYKKLIALARASTRDDLQKMRTYVAR